MGGVAGRKDVALTLGGRVFYGKHKWPRREGQVGSQRKPGLVKEGAAWRGQAPQQEGRVGAWERGRGWPGGGGAWLTVEGGGVVFFLSRPGRGLAGTLAVLLAFRPDSRSSSGRLFSALLL